METMTKFCGRAACLFVGSVMAACGGQAGLNTVKVDEMALSARADGGLCVSIGGGGASTTAMPCPGACSIDSPENAVDGSFSTAAGLSMPADPSGSGQSGGFLFSGAAQEGVVFPAGTVAGVVLGGVSPSNSGDLIQINTYLGQQPAGGQIVSLSGDIQGNGDFFCEPSGATCEFSGDDAFVGMASQSDFDRIEIGIIHVGAGTEPLQVYEFCTR